MVMKKLINDPDNLVTDLLKGLVKAHSDLLELRDRDILLRKSPKEPGKVQIVFGQGIGHEPGYDGMLGFGMHDVEVPGGIFACSGGDRIYEGIKIAWEMSGHTPVLLLIANHEGDVINGNMAVELARADGIDVEPVLLYDDIASAPKGDEENRRGMAGITFCFKIAGAMAEEGRSRDEIVEKVQQVIQQTRTLAVAVRPGTVPMTGQVMFDLGEEEIIIGPGVHGEPGPEGPIKLASADEVMEVVANRLLEDGEFRSGDEVLVLINGSGSTTLMEMFILYDSLEKLLSERGIKPYRPLIANVVTTQETAGFSLSLCRADAETKRLWDAPANTPYFKVCAP